MPTMAQASVYLAVRHCIGAIPGDQAFRPLAEGGCPFGCALSRDLTATLIARIAFNL
jgi:hypothetical protein